MNQRDKEKFFAAAGILPPKNFLKENDDEMGGMGGEGDEAPDLSAADQGAEMGGDEGGGDEGGITLSFTPEEKSALVSLAHKIIEAFGSDEGAEEGGMEGEEDSLDMGGNEMTESKSGGKSAWGGKPSVGKGFNKKKFGMKKVAAKKV